MQTSKVVVPSALGRFLYGGAVAGALSALVNAAYFLGYRAVTDIRVHMPTLGSIALASLLPSLLAAFGFYTLTRLTRRATLLFVLITSAITLASFESMFRPTLPDGSLKPYCFDLLVMPMHALVGVAAAWLIPRLAVTACRAPAQTRS